MRIRRLELHDYKVFRDQQLELNGKSTVIFGINGVGKSSLLDAMSYLLWPFLYRLNNAQGAAFKSLGKDMVRIGQSQLEMVADIEINGEDYPLRREFIKGTLGKAARNITPRDLYEHAVDVYVNAYSEQGQLRNLPVIISYGTNRSVLDIPLRIRKGHGSLSQMTALEHALENRVDFGAFFEWFRNQEDTENEEKASRRDLDYEDMSLRCVRKAIEAMLEDVSDLRVKRNPLRMVVRKGDTELQVDYLSDGEKCMLALLGDLARRLALANPYLDNPLDGEGIVIIDEIELHMHPSWQRKILKVLSTTFPNIQFIVTTHSPQILGEVDESLCLYGIQSCNGESVIEPYHLYGWDSNGILHSVMQTSDRPEIIERKYQEFDDALDRGDLDGAKAAYDWLAERVAQDDPRLTACAVAYDLERMS